MVRVLERRRTQEAIERAHKRRAEAPPQPVSGRIVSLPPPARVERPDEAHLLAADAHRAEQERISRHRTLLDQPAAKQQQEEQKAAAPATQPTAARQDGGAAARATKPRQPSPPKARSPSPTGVAPAVGPSAPPRSPPRRALGLSDLLPSVAALARSGGAPVSDVDTNDAPEGDTTELNTRSFRYAGFFDRISQKMRPHWHIYEAAARVRRRGQILMEHESYKSTVHVELDDKGRLRSAVVVEACGIEEFDAAAKGAVQEAAPFLNPPHGLLDAAGHVGFDLTFGVSVEPGRLFEGLGWHQDSP